MSNAMRDQLLSDIKQLYQQVANDSGVNIAECLRLEGQASMLLAAEVVSLAQLQQVCEEAYTHACSRPFDAFFWQWLADKNQQVDNKKPVFMIPIQDREAPVYPS